MKRNVFFRLVLVAFVTTAAIWLGACKKELVTPINNNSASESYDNLNCSAEARRIVGKIKRFKTQIIEKEYLTKGDSYIPIDSVIWNVEALFNASYTFPDRKYLETVKQNLEFFVVVNDKKEVLMSNVANLYDEIIEAVRQAYAHDGVSVDKSLMAVDVEEGDFVGNTVGIIVHVISGKVDNSNVAKEPVSGPFGPGDCWYFGEYGGSCDDPSAFGDAAEIIEDSINYYYRRTGVPNSGYRSINHSIVRVFLSGNEYVDDYRYMCIVVQPKYGDQLDQMALDFVDGKETTSMKFSTTFWTAPFSMPVLLAISATISAFVIFSLI